MAFSTPAYAQNAVSAEIAQNRADGTAAANQEAINNGTDPTLLTTTAGVQYKYNDLLAGADTSLLEFYYSRPIGAAKRMSWQLTLPFATGVTDSDLGLGDIGLKFTHVVALNKSRGLAYTAEVTFDTAERPELGAGQTTLELSGFYAKFLNNGGIFAPALVQTIGLGDPDPGRSDINLTTLDLYYVPKLANPKYFITYDPAVVYDWERDALFGSLTVTFGSSIGEAFGGNATVFVKPQILFGADRPSDWSTQVGFKVIGF